MFIQFLSPVKNSEILKCNISQSISIAIEFLFEILCEGYLLIITHMYLLITWFYRLRRLLIISFRTYKIKLILWH